MNKKPKDKFETFLKFTALGLAGAVISSGLMFKDDVVNTYEKNKVFSETVKTLKEEIKDGVGVLGNYVINIKTGVEYQSVRNVWGSYAGKDNVDNGSCTLMLTAGGSLDNMTKLTLRGVPGVTEEAVDKLNAMIPNENMKKTLELIGYHELYHCDEEVKQGVRFDIAGFNELSSALNSFYLGGNLVFPRSMMMIENSGDTLLMNGSLDTLLSEGYAETASSVVMARKYGEDVIPVMAHRQALSGLNRVHIMDNNPHLLPSHTTDAISNYYMSPEGLKEAQELKTVEQVREKAWERANTNVLEALKSRKNTAELINDKYWNKETLEAWRAQIIQEKKDLRNLTTPLMKERVDELKSKLPQELKDEFVKVTIDDDKKSTNQTTINAYLTYNKIMENFPKLETGADQIKIIQRDLPVAVNAAKMNPVYELKNIEEVFESANTFKSTDLKINKDLIKNGSDVVENKATNKMKI